MKTPKTEQVVELARKKGLLRPRDLAELGIPRQYLRLALNQGRLERVARGLYRVPGAMISTHTSFAEVCKRAPSGVICLTSALSFHELTTQIAHAVCLAIDEKAHSPRIETVAVDIFRFSGAAFTEGVETHDVEGVEVRVYSAPKTVADYFKYRNKLGIDVAIEALRDCLSQHKASVNDLVYYSRVCRVDQVMRPYLEAMLA